LGVFAELQDGRVGGVAIWGVFRLGLGVAIIEIPAVVK